jgi:hypothetical protein
MAGKMRGILVSGILATAFGVAASCKKIPIPWRAGPFTRFDQATVAGFT